MIGLVFPLKVQPIGPCNPTFIIGDNEHTVQITLDDFDSVTSCIPVAFTKVICITFVKVDNVVDIVRS